MQVYSQKGISGATAALLIVVVIIVAGALYLYIPPKSGSTVNVTLPGAGGGASSTQTIVSANPCASSQNWVYQTLASHPSGDATLSNLAGNLFVLSNGLYNPINPAGDNPGALTDGTGVNSKDTMNLNSGFATNQGATLEEIYQSSAVNSYQIWAFANSTHYVAGGGSGKTVGGATYVKNGQTITQPGISVFSIACIPGSTAGVYNWLGSFTVPEAADSAASATTNSKAVVVYPGATPTTIPSTTSMWTFKLQSFQTYKTMLSGYKVYGVSNSLLTDYGNGQKVYGQSQSGSVAMQTVGVIVVNDTSTTIQLDPSAPSTMSLTQLNLNGITSGQEVFLVTGILSYPGLCPSTTTSSSPCDLAVVPIDVSNGSGVGVGHSVITFQFLSEQQPGYIQTKLTTGSTIPTATAGGTSTAGVAATFTNILTPTSGNNAGNPAPLYKQYVAIKLGT